MSAGCFDKLNLNKLTNRHSKCIQVWQKREAWQNYIWNKQFLSLNALQDEEQYALWMCVYKKEIQLHGSSLIKDILLFQAKIKIDNHLLFERLKRSSLAGHLTKLVTASLRNDHNWPEIITTVFANTYKHIGLKVYWLVWCTLWPS